MELWISSRQDEGVLVSRINVGTKLVLGSTPDLRRVVQDAVSDGACKVELVFEKGVYIDYTGLTELTVLIEKVSEGNVKVVLYHFPALLENILRSRVGDLVVFVDVAA